VGYQLKLVNSAPTDFLPSDSKRAAVGPTAISFGPTQLTTHSGSTDPTSFWTAFVWMSAYGCRLRGCDVGLGPKHDWSSHMADAFGLMAVCAEDPGVTRAFNRKIEYPRIGIV
jgi:hypothetical protein